MELPGRLLIVAHAHRAFANAQAQNYSSKESPMTGKNGGCKTVAVRELEGLDCS
jgi:hypothetical protein